MAAHMDKAQATVCQYVVAAQAEGDVTTDLPPEYITLMLMTFVAGLSAVLKGPVNAEQAHELAELQLSAVSAFCHG